MTMVQVEVKVEVDIIEVMEDKHVHKVGLGKRCRPKMGVSEGCLYGV